MGSSSMKVHPFARTGLWDHHHHQAHDPPAALSLGYKRLRPLAPKLNHHDAAASATTPPFDLKSFIKPDGRPRKLASPSGLDKKDSTHQVETQPGGTRWNPTQEQIGILEMLYRGGMRTPNAQQIEQITEQLSKYGKIEGKNVFYWFQNHKARERQKMKRTILGLCHRPRTPPPASPVPLNTSITLTLDTKVEVERQELSPYKRNCRSWAFETSSLSEENNMTANFRDEGHKTLELFPLHPEGR